MAGQAKVTHEMLTAAGNKATETGESIASGLTRLLAEIEASSGGFKGVAGSAFQNASAELSRELRGILQALNHMAQEVHASNRQYGSTDEDAGREIGNVVSQYAPNSSVANALRG